VWINQRFIEFLLSVNKVGIWTSSTVILPSVITLARCWWFLPVILATWEAEIKRIEV
jgi:hypothetical protein